MEERIAQLKRELEDLETAKRNIYWSEKGIRPGMIGEFAKYWYVLVTGFTADGKLKGVELHRVEFDIDHDVVPWTPRERPDEDHIKAVASFLKKE
jgi:hypothetical protein